MKVLLTGGGTGGHITPLLAVAKELKGQQPQPHILYVGERHGKFSHLTDGEAAIDSVHTIYSGKFRRYHGERLLKRILDIKTISLNVRDSFYLLLGFCQSLWLLSKHKPDVIFLKGGYVGVPIGLAAAFWRIPFITHDSDAVPGLANRVVSRWARVHAVAGNAADYPYPDDSVAQVGVIVGADYKPVNAEMQQQYKNNIGIHDNAPTVLVTGGSLGAERLNEAIKSNLEKLLAIPNLHLIHQVGKGKAHLYDGLSEQRLHVYEFLIPMHEFTGAADIVITRAGANTLAELGVQGKACIIVPNDQLTDGHQTKNAAMLEEAGAAMVMGEAELKHKLLQVVSELLDSKQKRDTLGKTIQAITRSDAAVTIANLIVQQAQK